MDSHQYILLIYQVPSQPSAARVGIWRELKRTGALYLQQSVCILPHTEPLLTTLEKVCERIAELGGSYHLFPLHDLPEEEEQKIIDGFLAQSNLQYDEIIENCQVNFTKEIEFETFRQNFTYAEAEEIRQELDKIRRWYERTVERDWFGAARRDESLQSIEQCEKLLEEFEEKVFLKQEADESHGVPPVEEKKRLHPRRLERRSDTHR
ncbi:Chromate resistance protein ChrB [Ktedonobacter racemifer]|uniref:ChrB N-terminal domain-containing protein n=1 Tax=Ktedonobacter racemifer DSM 44963 TaxID=485913 RepID=D6TZV5_KTERA|nr:Chromate resistance protein ChrB [Ktedonobacter racemifer]EFH82095.1 conserved hypothetical protein [Ktedonobacter racemifer DSM 44963]